MIGNERGLTLPELLVAMSLMVVILLATLSVFDATHRNESRNQLQNDALEQSRVTIDQVARQLRNLANPTSAGTTIRSAQPYDVIFQTSDPSKTWVRYCLKTTGSGASTTGTLYYSVTAGALTSSEEGACPGTGWPAGFPRVVATNVTNQLDGANRPLFSYSCATPLAPTQACPADDHSKITYIGTDAFVDINPAKAPAERRVASGVYLRNQNEPPTASFTWAPAGTKTVVLNASASDDPEGRTLHYYWWKGSGTIGTTSDDSCLPAVGPTATFIGEGVTLTYRLPATDTNTNPLITLVVKDPGCLSATFQRTDVHF